MFLRLQGATVKKAGLQAPLFLWELQPQSAVPERLRSRNPYFFTGMGVDRSTGTAVMLFCGEPSMSLSEYDR